MATIKLKLDTRRALDDGSYPLVFRITSLGEARDIHTGFYAKRNQFHEKARTLRKNHPAYQLVSKRLQELENEYLSKLLTLEKTRIKPFTAAEIKSYLQGAKEQTKTVYSFWEREIELLQRSGRNGGARVYKQALSVLHKVRSLQIPFESLDISFIKQLEADLITQGIKANSVGVYFRTLRAVYNKAIDANLVNYKEYPFRRYKIRKEPTKPRVLSIDELRKYFDLQMSESSTYYDSWLIGKIQFMLMGINFTDMALLTKSSIQHGRVFYIRSKTKKQYSVKLLPEAEAIIEYFRVKNGVTILNLISEKQLFDKRRLPYTLHQANKVYNSHLKKIGEMIGTKEKLTGYCFRYTFANLAKQLNFSKDLISEALGHSYGNRVTGIYLENFDLEHIDKMNQTIYNHVIQK